MKVRFWGLAVDASDPLSQAGFWAAILGRDSDGPLVVPAAPTDLALRFVASAGAKTSQNRIHLDLTSDSTEDRDRLVARALGLGGRHADVGQGPDERHVVLADPEGNEFCVIPPGNRFLAGTGRMGAVNCDGTRLLGYFWHQALDWPLVWDQDEETAIQSPVGGPKVTWSGRPLMTRPTRDRIRFELTAEDVSAAAARLRALGAAIADGPPTGHAGSVLLRDPDDNEFTLRPG